MPKQLPNVGYQEANLSQNPPITLLGVHGVITQTQFGPSDKPYEITSAQQFKDTFGSYGADSPFYAQIIRALNRGVTLYIQRLVATGATAAHAALQADITANAKEVGTWPNAALSLEYTTLANGVNGVPGTNQLKISYGPDDDLNEVWQSDSLDHLIALVNSSSALINLVTTVGYAEPADSSAAPIYFAAGADGAFANAAAQDAAVEALFTNFDDSTLYPIDALSVFGSYTEAGFSNLKAYVEARQDIMGLFELDPTLTTAQALTFMGTLANLYSQWMAIYWGSELTAYSPDQSKSVSGGVLADVVAVWAASDTIANNQYKSPAGLRRGTIPNVTSFGTNLLAPSKGVIANQLTAAGVNIVGSDPTAGPCVFGAMTFAQSNSALDAIQVRRTLTSMRKQLLPIYRSELFEPMSPVSWRDAYTKAKKVLDAFVSAGAIYPGYSYVGDQESSTIGDAKYNSPADLANGLYKVSITVVPVGYIDQIQVVNNVNNLETLFNTTESVL